MIAGLAYFGLNAPGLSEWERVASEVLGVAASRGDAELRLRYDERSYRIRIHENEQPGFRYVGWEVRSPGDIDSILPELDGLGLSVEEMKPDELSDRAIQRGIRFSDAIGNEHHVVYAPTNDSSPFVSPTGARFLTGPQGAGHLVFRTGDHDHFVAFLETLGMRVSDRIEFGPVRLTFLHCNGRHHSAAVITADGMPSTIAGIHHFMLQVDDLDTVGLAYDKCMNGALALASTLGRHTNDRMVSFYAHTPSDVEVEFGWGAIDVSARDWRVSTWDRPSVWGHHREQPAPSKGIG